MVALHILLKLFEPYNGNISLLLTDLFNIMGKERVEHLIGSKRKDSKVCKLEITITYIRWLEDFPEHN